MKWGLVAAAALAAGALSASADAAVLYSLTGTIGDSSWTAEGPGQYLLAKDYFALPPSPAPPNFEGSSGTFSAGGAYYFKFSTAGEVQDTFAFDDLLVDGGELVIGPEGGAFSAYGGGGIDGGGQVFGTNTAHTFSFQTGAATSTYEDLGYVTDDIPPDDTFQVPVKGELVDYQTNTAALDVGWDIVAMGKGQAFSLVLFSAVPEPKTWALMISGVAAIGAALRSARRRAVAA